MWELLTHPLLIALLIHSLGATGSVIPPNLCERNMCNLTSSFCSVSVPGLYRYLGPACSAGSSCTACNKSSSSGVVECLCEKLPFRTVSPYGQSCGYSADCSQGICYRPCSTYLFSADCPLDRCEWSLSSSGGACVDFSPLTPLPVWTQVVARLPALNISEQIRGEAIVNASLNSSMFPIRYSAFVVAATDYLVKNSVSLQKLITLETFFMLLDLDLSGSISETEFAALPSVLSVIAETIPAHSENEVRILAVALNQLVPSLTGSDILKCLNITSESLPSLVQACSDPDLQGLICNADRGKFFCHLTQTCMSSCSQGCSWLNAENTTSYRCTPASQFTCKSRYFCPSLSSCVASCSECTGLEHPDTTEKICRSSWWGASPPLHDWVCASRKSSDQSCVSDMDCVYGLRVCSDGACIASNNTCSADRDCGIGYFCPPDPTLGEDPFYVQDCKLQGEDGAVCAVNGDCGGAFRCNFLDSEKTEKFPGICRPLFSQNYGVLVSDPLLCLSGQTGVNGACVVPFTSRRLGQVCTSDEDCPTYDESGSLGSCECTGWWEAGPCKRCSPVFGDLANQGNAFKVFLAYKAKFCASFWTLDECLSESFVVKRSYHVFMCEQQTVAGGVSLLSPSSGCRDEEARTDYCQLLKAV